VTDIRIALPGWVADLMPAGRACGTPDERMDVAIALARENVRRGTGGPFGAVVFDLASGQAVAAGVNLVEQAGNALLHAEVVALMFAQRAVGRYTLNADDLPPHALVTSCDPCAMCLGATLWSGVRDLECGAMRDDAVRIGFDEGPVFPASWDYLEARGVRVRRGIRRAAAAAVLEDYRRGGGVIYNG
jgi:tRNA(Arg) A34 adenosine deaminase TadA